MSESRHIKYLEILLELLAYSKFPISQKFLSSTLPAELLRRGIFRERVFIFMVGAVYFETRLSQDKLLAPNSTLLSSIAYS